MFEAARRIFSFWQEQGGSSVQPEHFIFHEKLEGRHPVKSPTPPTPLSLCSSSSVYILFDFANLLLPFQTGTLLCALQAQSPPKYHCRLVLFYQVQYLDEQLVIPQCIAATLPENMYFKLPTSKHILPKSISEY